MPAPNPVSEAIGDRKPGKSQFPIVSPITMVAGPVTGQTTMNTEAIGIGPAVNGVPLGNTVADTALSLADFNDFVNAMLAITDTLDAKIRSIVDKGPLACPGQCNI